MIDQTHLERYLDYLREVPEVFGQFPPSVDALVQARRIARKKAGLTLDDVEAAARAIAWTREHAAEIDAAESKAEAPFLRP